MEQPQSTPPQSEKKEKPNPVAVFSYLGILFIVPYFVAKDDEFVKFHVKQGLVLFVAELITSVIIKIPILGWFTGTILSMIWVVFSILGILNVLSGKKAPLPLIGQFAEKFNI